MPYVYILESEDGRHYTGSTVDLQTRLKRHNAGTGSITTKKEQWHVIHTEEYSTIAEARKREKQIKSYKGGNAFKKLIEH